MIFNAFTELLHCVTMGAFLLVLRQLYWFRFRIGIDTHTHNVPYLFCIMQCKKYRNCITTMNSFIIACNKKAVNENRNFIALIC